MQKQPKVMYAFTDFLTPGMYYYLSEDKDYVEAMMRYCIGGITDDFHYGKDRLRLVEIDTRLLEHIEKWQISRPLPEDYTNESKRDYRHMQARGSWTKIPGLDK